MSIDLRTCRRILKGLNLSDEEIIEVRDAIEGIAGHCIALHYLKLSRCGDFGTAGFSLPFRVCVESDGQRFKMVEPVGVEPTSGSASQKTSTSLVTI